MNFRRIYLFLITFTLLGLLFINLFWNQIPNLYTLKRIFNSIISINIFSNDGTEKSHFYIPLSKNSCVVILTQELGRLGNLMFKFASAYGLARIHGCRFYVDPAYMKILNATFTIDIKHLSISESEFLNLTGITYRDNTACHYFDDLMKPDSIKYIQMSGYWQVYRYFINYTAELRQQFTFRPKLIQEIAPFLLKELKWHRSCRSNCKNRNKNETTLSPRESNMKNQLDLKNKLRRSSVTFVGVHWRRGDHLQLVKLAYGHVSSSLIYLNRAMNYFLQKYVDVLFIITSDDKNYCEEVFKNNSRVIITPKNFTREHDLAALTVCQHTIVTSGSFGWFAGYLTGGEILYDKLSPTKNSSMERDCPPVHYYPPYFIPTKR